MAAHDQLTALDATFLELEQADDSALMHIGGALVFEPLPGGVTPGVDELRRHLEHRLARLPRYRQNERGFLDWASDFYSHRLDRSRPLWEMVLLDGLADGRWALVWKTHHCLVDGVGSVGVVGLLLDDEAVPHGTADPPETQAGDPGEAAHGWFLHPPGPVRQTAGAGLAAARAGAHALIHPREVLERSRGVVDLLIRDELIAAPHSSLNLPIGSTRRIATVHVELEELRNIRSALGGTVNDVILCAATAALRKLLLARGEDLPRQGLRAMVPVNIRVDGDRRELGNKVSSLFVELPVAEGDPLRRYELVRAAADKQKAGGQALASATLTGLTELAPPVLHASIARSLFAKRLFNVTITNVPASPSPLYAFGAPMIDVIPIVPLAAEHALGIAIVSYAGGVTFGLCADRSSVPDLDVLKDGIVTSVSELLALAGTAAAPAESA